MFLEFHFHSESTDGLRKYVESVKCPVDELHPTFDPQHSSSQGVHVLRYITCCRELNGILKRKVSTLHTGMNYVEGLDE